MLRFLSTAAWVLSAISIQTPLAAQAPIRLARVDGAEGDRIHRAFSRYAQYGFSGVVLVRKGGHTILHASYGWADRERTIPMEPNTVLDIQSTTKPIVASLAVRLVEQGLLALDTPLGAVFTNLDEPHGRVTLRRLLSHTSGLTRDEWQGLSTRQEVIARFGAIPLDTGAVSKFEYMNLNYAVAKALLEEKTGEQFESLLAREVLRPVGASMSFEAPASAAVGYDGMPGAFTRAIGRGQEETYAGGTLWSSAGDLARWEEALQGGSLVSPAWLDTIRTPVGNGYGLGWFVYPGGILYHGGDGFGYQSTIMRSPGAGDLAFVVLTNVRPYSRDLWWRSLAMKAIQFAVTNRDLALPPDRTLTEESESEWLGEFASETGDTLRIQREPLSSGLIVTAAGVQAVTALGGGEEDVDLLQLLRRRSRVVMEALSSDASPADSVVTGERWRDLLTFLNEYAPELTHLRSTRWELQGFSRGSGQQLQAFLRNGDTHFRLLWDPETQVLTGWGLGGDVPAAAPAGIKNEAELVIFLPNRDLQIVVGGQRAGASGIETIRFGSLTLHRRSREMR